jgi:hypothetical protein
VVGGIVFKRKFSGKKAILNPNVFCYRLINFRLKATIIINSEELL